MTYEYIIFFFFHFKESKWFTLCYPPRPPPPPSLAFKPPITVETNSRYWRLEMTWVCAGWLGISLTVQEPGFYWCVYVYVLNECLLTASKLWPPRWRLIVFVFLWPRCSRVDAFFPSLNFAGLACSEHVSVWNILSGCICHHWSNQQSRQTVTWSADWTEWHWRALLNFILDKFLSRQQHISVRNWTKLACVPTCCMNMLNTSRSHLVGSSENTANN